MNKIALGVVFTMLATSVSAQSLVCERTRLARGGFKSIQGADSWFPERLNFKVEGDTVLSDYYGEGTVTRENNRQYFEFVGETNSGFEYKIEVTYIEKTKRYSTRLGDKAGYQTTVGSGGKCAVRG